MSKNGKASSQEATAQAQAPAEATPTAQPARLPRPVPFDSAWGLKAALATFFALCLFGFAYRLRVGYMLGDTFASEVPRPLLALLRQSGADVMFALFVAALVLLSGQLLFVLDAAISKKPSRTSLALRTFGLGLLGLLLFVIGLLAEGQHSAFFTTGNGLTAQLIEESASIAALKELGFLLTPAEAGFIVLPLGLFVLLFLLPHGVRRILDRMVGLSALLAVAAAGVFQPAPLPAALLHHPVGFFALELTRTKPAGSLLDVSQARAAPHGRAAQGAALDSLSDEPPAADLDADLEEPAKATAHAEGGGTVKMALDSPEFVFSSRERPVKTALVQPIHGQAPPYNILFVILESTGFEYALRPIENSGGTRVAMPFLRSLGDKGYLLLNHFSSGNSSPRGIFSLFSGLYVMPEVSIFDVRKDIYLPSLGSYLGERYHRFLVTPGSLDWYFPHAFFLHSGMSELFGYHAVPIRKNAPGGRSHARDEAETVGFFLRRLDEHARSGAPFLAVYYSFLAHWPYPDYGKETHIVNPTRPLFAYYNDLSYLDTQLERIVKHLEEKQLLERTILVLVGDHGEAFGQHPHNYTHSRMSYNENLRTPAILYHPALFPPRRITEPTSHVDILPTLLDATGVSYDKDLLQGESLFQDAFRRRYIFTYGNEDTLSSVSSTLIKLQVSLRDGACWVFDLKSDPEERRRLGCQAHAEQHHALLLYRKHQTAALRRYNRLSFEASHREKLAPGTAIFTAADPKKPTASSYVVLGRLQAGQSP